MQTGWAGSTHQKLGGRCLGRGYLPPGLWLVIPFPCFFCLGYSRDCLQPAPALLEP